MNETGSQGGSVVRGTLTEAPLSEKVGEGPLAATFKLLSEQ